MIMDSGCREIVASDDFFDRLPDEVVLSIFDKLKDAKSLCLSMSVCKRFNSIAPQVADLFLPIPHRRSAVKHEQTHTAFFKNLLIRALMKPFSLISQMVRFKPRNETNDLDYFSCYVPSGILTSFQDVRALHLRLPCHAANPKQRTVKNIKNPSTFLKWKAEFGRELHSCVILGAKSWGETLQKEENSSSNSNSNSNSNSPQSDPESRFMADDELKLRIVWTISCLIAASARHYLIQETMKAQKSIENVVVSDESDQGRLCMNRDQIAEMRENLKGNGNETTEYRSRVPALRMKMWYLERLELPDSGRVMEGATLVVIRPATPAGGEGSEKVKKGIRSDGDMVEGAFGGGGEDGEARLLGEAVRKLMVAKKCYTLEMNAF